MHLSNRVVLGVGNFVREKNLSPLVIPTLSKDMDEQLKLAHKLADLVDRANRKNCKTLLRYNMNKSVRSYAQVRSYARNKEYEKFQQSVYVKSNF